MVIRRTLIALAVVALVASSCTTSSRTIVVGAMYPTAGGQGPGGADEYRGVRLAADLTNRRGGVDGKRIRLDLVPANSADVVPDAMHTLMRHGATVVLGSYGSTMSAAAARVAAKSDVVFWETGAVGILPQIGSDHVFRVPPTGTSLGRAAVEFVRNVYLPKTNTRTAPRYGVAFVDDVYGRSVGDGAIGAIRASGTAPATFPYDVRRTDFDALARRIADARVDVLVVGAYLKDGVALRRALVRQRVPLIANIGTSSSYCMPEFGRELGRDAVGVFASDKPDGDSIRAGTLRPDAMRDLQWATETYRRRFHEEMSAPALAGFSAALALFGDVLPAARNASVAEIVRAAHSVTIPERGLPNGSGLAFGAGAPSENLRAVSVIWEWVAPNTRAIVWPPAYASHDVTAT